MIQGTGQATKVKGLDAATPEAPARRNDQSPTVDFSTLLKAIAIQMPAQAPDVPISTKNAIASPVAEVPVIAPKKVPQLQTNVQRVANHKPTEGSVKVVAASPAVDSSAMATVVSPPVSTVILPIGFRAISPAASRAVAPAASRAVAPSASRAVAPSASRAVLPTASSVVSPAGTNVQANLTVATKSSSSAVGFNQMAQLSRSEENVQAATANIRPKVANSLPSTIRMDRVTTPPVVMAHAAVNSRAQQLATTAITGQRDGRQKSVAEPTASGQILWTQLPTSMNVTNPTSVVKPNAGEHVHLASPNAPSTISGIIVRQVTAGANQVEVTVHPEGLGNLVISVNKTDNGLNVAIVASHATTADWLHGESQRIIDSIQSNGQPVQSFNLSFGQSGFQQSQSHGQNRQAERVAQQSFTPAEVQRVHPTEVRPIVETSAYNINLRA